DHVIGSVENFHHAVTRGIAAAEAGKLVTFGVKPRRPETGYGYIQAGAALEDADGVLSVDRFVEKPDAMRAATFVDSGVFYWNSGIFLLGAGHFIAELQRLHPKMLDACTRAVEGGA